MPPLARFWLMPTSFRFRVLALLVALWVPLPALGAGPTDLVTVVAAPEGQGAIFSPGIRILADISNTYVEEEFFISGAANNYTYAETPVRDELLVLQADVPYTTRIIVRRPANPEDFSVNMVVDQAEAQDLFGEHGCGTGGGVAMAILPFAWWRRARAARQKNS